MWFSLPASLGDLEIFWLSLLVDNLGQCIARFHAHKLSENHTKYPYVIPKTGLSLRKLQFIRHPRHAMSYLQDTRNLSLVVISSLAFVLGSSFFATYGAYLCSIIFMVDTSLLLAERSQLFSLYLGCFNRELSFFLSTTSTWVVVRSHTSANASIWPYLPKTGS